MQRACMEPAAQHLLMRFPNRGTLHPLGPWPHLSPRHRPRLEPQTALQRSTVLVHLFLLHQPASGSWSASRARSTPRHQFDSMLRPFPMQALPSPLRMASVDALFVQLGVLPSRAVSQHRPMLLQKARSAGQERKVLSRRPMASPALGPSARQAS